MSAAASQAPDEPLAVALSHHGDGRLEEALVAYDAALERSPDQATTLLFKGAALAQNGRLAEALPILAEGFASRPDRKFNAAARRVLLIAIGAAVKRDAAEGPVYREGRSALSALCAWGMGLLRLRRADEALGFFDHALDLMPKLPMALLQKALALELLDRMDEAIANCRAALELEPKMTLGYLALGRLLNAQKDWVGSIAALERAQALDPGNLTATGALVMSKRIICDWQNDARNLEGLSQACERSRAEGKPGPMNPSFALNLPLTPQQQKGLAEQHAEMLFGALNTVRRTLDFSFEGRARTKPRLRIAYSSEGFRNFPTSHLIQRLFAHHDREGFEVIAYSYGPDDGSSYRKRIMKTVDRFVDLRELSDEQAARRIYEDEVDILIDLKGYTINARPRITALRPAPIQVNYLGYAGTWGSAAIDYILVDRVIVPSEEAANYSENLVHLPNCYQVNDDRQVVDPTPQRRADHGLDESAFVFCCFNNALKFDPEIFDLWMRILHRVPGSQLWLLDSNPTSTQNLKREAEARGIPADRVVFAAKRPKPLHLARHNLADLFLDTSVYSAHTTGTDALWMGLPLIVCPAPTFPGRVSASLLTYVGLPELIVDSFEAYEALAVRLAESPTELAALKARLVAQRSNCRLFDTEHFARGLEAAYRAMWAHYEAGRPPEPIEIRDEDLADGRLS